MNATTINQMIVDEVGKDTYYSYTVKEMYTKVNSWRSEPSGRFQVNILTPGNGRDKIFRTKKDGSIDIKGIKEAINEYVTYLKMQVSIEEVKKGNRELADLIKSEYKGKNHYISSYESRHATTSVSASAVPGKVNVVINFGLCDPEKAVKIMNFLNEMENQ